MDNPPTATRFTAPGFDPGLTQQYTGTLKRVINKDGHFNVRRTGSTWRDFHPYLYMVNVSWPVFFALVGSGFLITNVLFAVLYSAIGVEHVKNATVANFEDSFINVFFFSAHTLTTVGYGNMYPDGIAANCIAAFEALLGLMGFAIATGLLFGRFSRPSARIGFSDRAIIAPYREGRSLQFRVVNRRPNNLIDVEARVLLMTVELCSGKLERRYRPLALERPTVLFFPLTWTVVHPIDENSPLFGNVQEDLRHMQAEILIMIKAFDDTFGQSVHSRYSYRFDELVWGARFAPAFEIDQNGDLQVEVNRVGLIEPAVLPE